MKDLEPWYNIYKKRMNEKYFEHVEKKYDEFIYELLHQQAAKYVELGCGAGNITRALRKRMPEATYLMLDNCGKMLSLATDNNPGAITFLQDVFKMRGTYWKYLYEKDVVVHSHGVLEHYPDTKIRTLIKLNSRCTQIHYVPGKKYKTPSRGDERLLSVDDWKRILRPTKLNFCIWTFNNGHDYIIKVGPRS